ncbi:Ppx/GppA family phosphatase [Roseospira marina]|uniref:Ppx/GppA family phosphatase n=1 Tax=Roseospira marina TaxID=140057 RepID=A0A5M6IH75_9PROT|nr:Ppx/GppA phosphatase family protein [Roseospira marina]KAA5607584.1 Ppx/GppA family phosphatase [Roseospira marina]MBB4312224.1 exopolyphosphatase/guanosine-5'-triphosphate,3'-diphosphate pyrophosphatase [Roseospira marina]MBB5085760.1 exopolyphosphatase/guanosine-5'-triphosphate,3'-diphosphate pyrophosphatase [Roseospira marina]
MAAPPIRRTRDATPPPAASGHPAAVARPIFIALDLGTNNCRMLAARPDPRGGFRVVDSFSRITRLGEGLHESGRLSEAAMTRTIEALRVCARKMARHRVAGTRMVATAACRHAANTEAFLHRVFTETGLRLEVIPPNEEARLALAGCSPLLRAGTQGAVVFDIGGGSTELMWVAADGARDGPTHRPRIVDMASLPLGVVTVAEARGGDLCDASYAAVKGDVLAALAAFDARHGIAERLASGDSIQMLGTSGTVTTLGGVMLDLPRYDRDSVDGLEVDFISIQAVSRRLRHMSCVERAHHPCIGGERADLVVSGCAILEAICDMWPVGRLRIADRGIREGVLMDLMGAAEASA